LALGGEEARGGGKGNSEKRGDNKQDRRDVFYLLLSSCLRRQPTAVMRAAPFPLPSSDSRKLTLHWGASSFTVWCMNFEKLGKRFDNMLNSGVMESGPNRTRAAWYMFDKLKNNFSSLA